jgi:multisubunit Na+/H+ antiporter MnhC subunit
MIYSLCILLIVIGLYGVVVKRNALKIVICLLIMEHGVNLLFILAGYRAGGEPPILDPGTDPAVFAASAVDPLPQALVLTSIVIGLGVMALMVALCVRLHERYGSFDIAKMTRLRG